MLSATNSTKPGSMLTFAGMVVTQATEVSCQSSIALSSMALSSIALSRNATCCNNSVIEVLRLESKNSRIVSDMENKSEGKP